MADDKDTFPEEKATAPCASCGQKPQLRYWCEVCEKVVDEKRCPSCGLKTRKVR